MRSPQCGLVRIEDGAKGSLVLLRSSFLVPFKFIAPLCSTYLPLLFLLRMELLSFELDTGVVISTPGVSLG